MELENRYLVFKKSDLAGLNSAQREALTIIDAAVFNYREKADRAPLKCVVVESDWPEFVPTRQALTARIMGYHGCAVPPDDLNIRLVAKTISAAIQEHVDAFHTVYPKQEIESDVPVGSIGGGSVTYPSVITYTQAVALINASCSEESNNSTATATLKECLCPECGEVGMEVRDGVCGCGGCGYVSRDVTTKHGEDLRLFNKTLVKHSDLIEELRIQLAAMTEKYNKYFTLHHNLQVNKAGMENICCDALGIKPYQHGLYELILMLVSKVAKPCNFCLPPRKMLLERITELEDKHSEMLTVNSHLHGIMTELEDRGIHITSKKCWCGPTVDCLGNDDAEELLVRQKIGALVDAWTLLENDEANGIREDLPTLGSLLDEITRMVAE